MVCLPSVLTRTGTELINSPTMSSVFMSVPPLPETTFANTASLVRQQACSVNPQASSITVFSVQWAFAARLCSESVIPASSTEDILGTAFFTSASVGLR